MIIRITISDYICDKWNDDDDDDDDDDSNIM